MTMLAGAVGHPPEVNVNLTEKAKFEAWWEDDKNREESGGEQAFMLFLEQAKPWRDSMVIDFGCGTGRGGLMIGLMGGMRVTLMDFAANCLDKEVQDAVAAQGDRLTFIEHNLFKLIPAHAMYGYCVDVMECIPEDKIPRVLANILLCAQHVFFKINTKPGDMRRTVKSYDWWAKKFRDQSCVFHWTHNEDDEYCIFYVSSWADMDDITYEGKVNTEDDVMLKNVKQNIQGNWQRVHPHPMQNTEIMMVCGGPSLNDYTDEIIQLRAEGMPMVTTNGTYNWAIANGMNPSLQLILDAREFNKRFLRPIVDNCKYMIASQCHPALLEGMPEDRTFLWHVGTGVEGMYDVLDEYYDWWFPVPGGSTVTLRGLCLLRMLGFHKIHMYGFDSCCRGDEHHAYDQPENDRQGARMTVGCGGTKTFLCEPWMYTQAEEFIRMMAKFVDDELQLNVKGDGLIAHIIETGAKLDALENDED